MTHSRSFKVSVTDVDTNRKLACDFLLMINTKWHPTSYRFEVIAYFCLTFDNFAVLSPPVGGLGITYTVHIRLIGRPLVDIILCQTKLYFDNFWHTHIPVNFLSQACFIFFIKSKAENQLQCTVNVKLCIFNNRWRNLGNYSQENH